MTMSDLFRLSVSNLFRRKLRAFLTIKPDHALTERFADVVLQDPEVLGVEALAADGVTIRVTTRVRPGSQWELQRAIREAVKARFDADAARCSMSLAAAASSRMS